MNNIGVALVAGGVQGLGAAEAHRLHGAIFVLRGRNLRLSDLPRRRRMAL